MISFKNDYSEGAHPNILRALIDSNLVQTTGYGEDIYTERAITLIKEQLQVETVDIHLLSGGTQVNLTAIAAFLRSHEAAIAVHTGHINTHETGAIEATGHKVVTIESVDGKLTPAMVQKVLDTHTDEHMVKPKLVYISNSTELGTIYQKEDVIALSEICKRNNLIFYMDGARLGAALCAEKNDLQMKDLCKYLDAFYIGGTKNGALLGEALVIVKDSLKEDFRYHIKQRGALLAKGRLLGIQFLELFKEGLYFSLATNANQMATILQTELQKLGYEFLLHSPTNQVFPIFKNEEIAVLKNEFDFAIWEPLADNRSIVRLVTSWATTEDAVWKLIETIKNK